MCVAVKKGIEIPILLSLKRNPQTIGCNVVATLRWVGKEVSFREASKIQCVPWKGMCSEYLSES